VDVMNRVSDAMNYLLSSLCMTAGTSWLNMLMAHPSLDFRVFDIPLY